MNEKLRDEIVNKALSLPAEERIAYLDEVCEALDIQEALAERIRQCEIEVPEEFLTPPVDNSRLISGLYQKLLREWE